MSFLGSGWSCSEPTLKLNSTQLNSVQQQISLKTLHTFTQANRINLNSLDNHLGLFFYTKSAFTSAQVEKRMR
ncbi:hypothetical protein ACOSP7_033106 [Xanthoceras sorbifolium]